jgi:hypothetical protein
VSAYGLCCTQLCRAVCSWFYGHEQRVISAPVSSAVLGRHCLASAGSRRPGRCLRFAMSSLPCVTVALCLLAHSELALGTVTLQFSCPARAAACSCRVDLWRTRCCWSSDSFAWSSSVVPSSCGESASPCASEGALLGVVVCSCTRDSAISEDFRGEGL